MVKSRKRAERRQKSFNAWMRRLQSDWWEHGSRIDPRSVYRNWKENGGACSIRRYRGPRDFSQIDFGCPCFDLKDNGATHFKNHPTGNKSRRRWKLDDWGSTGYKNSDRKRLEVEREYLGGRKKRRGKKPWLQKVSCQCGFFSGQWEYAEYRINYWGSRTFKCNDCKRRQRESGRQPIIDVSV